MDFLKDEEVLEQNDDLEQDDGLNEEFNVREYSDMLFDMIEDGTVDPVQIAEDLIYWCSEDDIKKYMRVNDLIFDEDEEESQDLTDEEAEYYSNMLKDTVD